MATVVFAPETSARVWANVRDHLDLLRAADGVRELRGSALAEAKAKLVAFICTAAYGYSRAHDAKYGSWWQRFHYLLRLNPGAYRLHLADEPVRVELDLAGGRQALDFGLVDGCTGVIPLTRSGFQGYMANRARLTDLAENEVSRWTGDTHVDRYLVITGAFHVPSIPGMDLPRPQRRQLQPGAVEVVCTLFRQVARFLPYLRLADSNRVVWAGDQTTELPQVVCPLSGLGMGDQLIEKLGFVPVGRDAGGLMEKYLLDLSAAHDRGTAAERRWSLRNAVRGLRRFTEYEREGGAAASEV